MGLSFEELTGVPGPARPTRAASARVSMADVAALAGVSGQTVSRVVNGSPRVDPATRARVEAAMSRLGYRPHRAARALRTGRTHTIGLVVSTLATVGNSRMLQAVADAASARGYALTVVTLARADAAAAAAPASNSADGAVADAFARLRDQGVDGAIVLNEASALVGTAAAPDGLALVVVDSPSAEAYTVVQTDHAAGAAAATAHLLRAGHRSVAHIGGPSGSFAAAERERGWREALGAADAPAPPVVRGDWTAASGYVAAQQIAADVTAVFVANDQMALGALRALADAGRRVPADISVVGFDDVADAADYRPPLTTVRQDFDALGAAAVAALVGAIDGASGSEARALRPIPAELIERASTAAPPSR